jgi:hypothetical protein
MSYVLAQKTFQVLVVLLNSLNELKTTLVTIKLIGTPAGEVTLRTSMRVMLLPEVISLQLNPRWNYWN